MVPLLVKHYTGEKARERWPGNPDVIRTYHEPDNRVVDHASGEQRQYSDIVGKRNLAPLIDARHAALNK
jgi:protein subunit release factor A